MNPRKSIQETIHQINQLEPVIDKCESYLSSIKKSLKKAKIDKAENVNALQSLVNNTEALVLTSKKICVNIDDKLEKILDFIKDAEPSEETIEEIFRALSSIQKYVATFLTQLKAQEKLDLTQEKQDVLYQAIEDSLAQIKESLMEQEEDAEENKEEEKSVSANTIESISYATPFSINAPVSTVLSNSSSTATRDILDLNSLSSWPGPESKNPPLSEAKEQEIAVTAESILNGMKEAIFNVRRKFEEKSNTLEHQNEIISKNIIEIKKIKNSLIKKEDEIKKSLLKSSKKRKDIPEQIKACDDECNRYLQEHTQNIAQIKSHQDRVFDLQKITNKINDLHIALMSYQKDSHFDFGQCVIDLNQIKEQVDIILNDHKKREAQANAVIEFFKLIKTMLTVHAPAQVRKTAMLKTDSDKLRKKEAEQKQQEDIKLDNIQLLLNRIEENKNKIAPLLNTYENVLIEDPTNKNALDGYSALTCIDNNLNQIAFALRTRPFGKFMELAKTEINNIPQDFTNRRYPSLINKWANLVSKKVDVLLNEEKEDALVQDEPLPKQPSFWRKVWNNKFTILGMTSGFLGGVALGIFTFGLSTVGLSAMAIFILAVGSSGIGGACSNGMFGYVVDRWLDPEEELPTLPAELRHNINPDIDVDSDSDDDHDMDNQKPKNSQTHHHKKEKAPSREQSDERLSQSRYSIHNGKRNIEVNIKPHIVNNGKRNSLNSPR